MDDGEASGLAIEVAAPSFAVPGPSTAVEEGTLVDKTANDNDKTANDNMEYNSGLLGKLDCCLSIVMTISESYTNCITCLVVI